MTEGARGRAAAGPAGRRRVWALYGLLALFVLTRLWLFVAAEPWDTAQRDTRFLYDDAAEYHQLATNLVDGNGYSSAPAEPFVPNAARTPLYPVFLATVISTLGGSVAAILSAQILLQLLTLGILYLLLSRLTSPLAAGLAALYCVVDPVYLNASAIVYSETLYQFLNVAFVLLLFHSLAHGFSIGRTILLGLLFGLGLLTRPLGLYFLPLLLAALMFRERPLRAAFARAVLLVAIAAAIVGPWLWRNQVVFGHASLSSLAGGHLYRYYALPFLKAEGLEVPEAPLSDNGAAEPTFDDPFERSTYYRGRTLEVIREHPVRYTVYHFRSSWRMFASASTQSLSRLLDWDETLPLGSAEITAIGSLGRRSPQAQAVLLFNTVLNVILLVAAAIGVASLARQRRWLILAVVVLGILYYVAIIGPEASSRYRLSLLPYLLYSAGIGLESLRRLRPRRPGLALDESSPAATSGVSKTPERSERDQSPMSGDACDSLA